MHRCKAQVQSTQCVLVTRIRDVFSVWPAWEDSFKDNRIMWSHKIIKAACFENSLFRQTNASKVQLRNHWTKTRHRSASYRAPGMLTQILSSWTYIIYTGTLFGSTITSCRAIFSLKLSEEWQIQLPLHLRFFFLTIRLRFNEVFWRKYFSMNGWPISMVYVLQV